MKMSTCNYNSLSENNLISIDLKLSPWKICYVGSSDLGFFFFFFYIPLFLYYSKDFLKERQQYFLASHD